VGLFVVDVREVDGVFEILFKVVFVETVAPVSGWSEMVLHKSEEGNMVLNVS